MHIDATKIHKFVNVYIIWQPTIRQRIHYLHFLTYNAVGKYSSEIIIDKTEI